MKAYRNWVKQRQHILPHYQLDYLSPGHTPVVGVYMCPCLHPSFASLMGRRAVGLVVVLLLLLSGDVETNPGPVGEGSVFNVEFPLTTVCYHSYAIQ